MTEHTVILPTEKLITLTIDRQQVSVPEGTLLVDAAKMIGVDIPVFCLPSGITASIVVKAHDMKAHRGKP